MLLAKIELKLWYWLLPDNTLINPSSLHISLFKKESLLILFHVRMYFLLHKSRCSHTFSHFNEKKNWNTSVFTNNKLPFSIVFKNIKQIFVNKIPWSSAFCSSTCNICVWKSTYRLLLKISRNSSSAFQRYIKAYWTRDPCQINYFYILKHYCKWMRQTVTAFKFFPLLLCNMGSFVQYHLALGQVQQPTIPRDQPSVTSTPAQASLTTRLVLVLK